MRRRPRALPCLLALVCALTLCGCASLYDTQYASAEPYQPPAAQEDEAADAPAYDNIANYAALRRAILALVTDHVESAQLQFNGYDGSVSQDLSTACWDVKSSTALGAFAVDYISYDLSRIVSYYQAEVNITYKRTAEQADALERVRSVSALKDRLDAALRAGQTYLVLEIADASATADTLREYVSSAYYADALACPVLPAVDAALFPETGVTRIAELTLDYGLDAAALSQRRTELSTAVEELTAGLTPAPASDDASPAPSPTAREQALDGAERLRLLCGRLADRCPVDDTAGATAWDALIGGAADSEGLALALQACCQSIGLDCRTVAGRKDGQVHCWNMATLSGTSYHVDVSGQDVFLSGDDRLWGVYWWDTSDYPACPADFSFSDEPAPTEAPDASPTPAPVQI